MNSSKGYLKSDYSPGVMNMKRDYPFYPPGPDSGYSKRQKEESDNCRQVEFCFPGQDIYSGRGGGCRRGGGGRRSVRDPRLGHAQFLKDIFYNPFLALPPKYQLPDFVQDPHNPVVGFRFGGIGGPPIPITALDTQKERATAMYTGVKTYGGTDISTCLSGDRLAELLERTKVDREQLAKKFDAMVRDEPEELRKKDLMLAQEAIKFYNATHGTCFEVVATLGSYHHLDCGHWFHCNFRARNTKIRSSQANLFFSEIFSAGAGRMGAKVCKMLDGPGQRPHTVLGCKICGNLLWHPVNGFECGK